MALREPLASRSSLAGKALEFERPGSSLRCKLQKKLGKGDRFRIGISYSGSGGRRGVVGFYWAKTKGGKPWINTSCQGPGAHSWWPCKASYYHPEDKPEHLYVNLDVPDGLYAVSNGRLLAREKRKDKGREVFRWQHDYPLETYAVTVNVAPYVVVEKELQLEGIEGKLPFIYYVLPENAEKAKLQFQQVPEMLKIFGKAFGPFPFPKSKFALVEVNFWGMEHSTAVAYGSSYPAWCKKTGSPDRYARRNRYFDYILIHESAHEWWGNAVSAANWGNFWVHEGFATYSEAVYVEFTQGREVADRYLATIKRIASGPGRLFRGKNKASGQAYSVLIYYKGAWVLNTLRHYVNDDAVWWKTLRDFNIQFRYKNAVTEDFRAILEKNTGRDWKQFFDEWFYGSGSPRLSGTVGVDGKKIVVSVDNRSRSEAGFHVPLDLAWKEGGREQKKRIMLEPGKNELAIDTARTPTDLRVVNLHRVLGRHKVEVDS